MGACAGKEVQERAVRDAQAAERELNPHELTAVDLGTGERRAIVVGAGNPIGCPCECYPHGLRRALFGGIEVDVQQTWAELGAEDGATVSVEVHCGSP